MICNKAPLHGSNSAPLCLFALALLLAWPASTSAEMVLAEFDVSNAVSASGAFIPAIVSAQG